MSTRKLLVSGAIGVTGKETVRLLREKGHSVRAFVHREDERSKALRKLGAEIALGDLRGFEVVRAALEGIQGAYLGSSPQKSKIVR
jgi:NAD(P)H dehydrogenase (quinone)